MFGAIHDKYSHSYTRKMFLSNSTYARLPEEESEECTSSEQTTGTGASLSRRLAHVVGFGFRALVLLMTVYVAVTLALRQSDCHASSTAMTNSFIPEYLRRGPQLLVKWDDYPEFDGGSKAADDAWDSLMPRGRGYIAIPNPAQYGLGRGKDRGDPDGDIYAISGFHQMHCLGIIREVFLALRNDSSSIDFSAAVHGHPPLGDHINHCIQYIRQGIMCAADPTIESLAEDVEQDGRVRVTDLGWGNTHVCRSWDSLKNYAAMHTHARGGGLGAKEYVAEAVRLS
ncbi:hypothetical protein CKM354_001286200 [Cercospora kikuchii]|uniref:Oxidase ustYa n=1 Tax=Cercospora kikuchii TaxID=84275 RepID=A0A9P3L2C8_9PEZI|nr:uncharacterized protein CKM354_001286200 [Cercospora kikuchii]GIZ49843.1 hypothetical protein CKM354_001286200 [Cercospora kikuchii]